VDSVINVTFEYDDGDFVAVGPVYIYRYEYEEGRGTGGGPMAKQSQDHSINKAVVTLSPNPFNRTLNIKFQTQVDTRFGIKLYDVTGRLVKNIYEGMINGNRKVTWKGDDEKSRSVSQGVYFLRIENLDTGETLCKKVLKIR